VLSGLRKHVSYTRHIYLNPSVVSALRRLKPSVILIEDFSPTMAVAALYARAVGLPYGLKTDGHRGIDPGETSRVHRAMRRLLVPHAAFGVCASEDSVAFLGHWGLHKDRAHIVPIVTAWDPPTQVRRYEERPFDILFAGGINEHIKGALFFVDVIAGLRKRGFVPRVRVTGEGPLREEVASKLRDLNIEAHFDGAVAAEAMAKIYGSAKLLLFPSRGDAWGLVANEAAICGTPVIGSPAAISSRRLVEACGVGLMRPMTVDTWVDATMDILSSPARWQSFSDRRSEVVSRFGLERSVAALAGAFASTIDAEQIASFSQ
jgi:glycosyltransferase involved in cell wall biosynthesis